MELYERIKTYLNFTKEEILDLSIAAVFFGFIFAFKDFSLINVIIAILIALLSFLFHVSAQKIVGLKKGYKTEFKISWFALIIPLILVFISNGKMWWLIIPGGVSFSILAGLRIGKFRYGLNHWDMGMVALSGPIFSIILATIFKQIDIWFFAASSTVLHSIFVFNLAYAVCQMLPFPPLDGHYLFYASRLTYVFIFGTILTYTVLSVSFAVYSWIFALLAGGLAWLIFYLKFERTAW